MQSPCACETDAPADGSTAPSLQQARALTPLLLAAAQAQYDAWDDTDLDTYAGGGICHLIADCLVDILQRGSIETASVCSNFEVHVFVVCKLAEGVFTLDLPHSHYERGAGYAWSKLPDVTFTAESLCWTQLDSNPDAFDMYVQ